MASWKYLLHKELAHATSLAPAPVFDNRWLTIGQDGDTASLLVSAGYAWDGCTLAPDLPGTHAASCLHDAVYQFAEPIAAASDWSVHAVLRWGDLVFKERMQADGAACWVVCLYSLAVRLLGYAYHRVARWVRLRQAEWKGRMKEEGASLLTERKPGYAAEEVDNDNGGSCHDGSRQH